MKKYVGVFSLGLLAGLILGPVGCIYLIVKYLDEE